MGIRITKNLVLDTFRDWARSIEGQGKAELTRKVTKGGRVRFVVQIDGQEITPMLTKKDVFLWCLGGLFVLGRK